MAAGSYENLKPIRFEGELLPNWAQLLDLAAKLCGVADETRKWLSRFTNGSGTDDARTVIAHCDLLRKNIRSNSDALIPELRRTAGDIQPSQVIAAWLYALDTMVQSASQRKTCSWEVEGADDEGEDGSGEITLRRV